MKKNFQKKNLKNFCPRKFQKITFLHSDYD